MIFKIFLAGAQPLLSEEIKANVVLINKIAVLLAVITAPFFFVFYPISKFLGILIIPISLSYLVSIFLNKCHKYQLSRLNLILCGSMAVCFYGVSVGENSCIQFVFLSFLFLPLVLFDFKKKKWVFISESISVFFLLNTLFFQKK